MVSQLDLLSPPQTPPVRRYRRTDPATSRLAAETHSKALGSQADEILRIIKLKPNSTACEIAEEWKAPMDFGDKRHAVSRRCPELEEDGFIRRSLEPRACKVKSKPGKPSMQHTWEAT